MSWRRDERGYIGSHACKALAAAGVESVVFDLAQAVQFGPLVTCDVRDSRALADCIRRYAIGAVLHFAGLMEVGRSMVKPPEFWDVNLDGVASLLASMRARGVRRVVILSTAAVYGSAAKGQLDEDDVTSPVNPYVVSKLALSALLQPITGPAGSKAWR
ncbi:NAD-dependent epimerase/dehydratase family protein [Brevundimonas diminuta]|uniref:NAD-dependent epimerase/dehydratase family protein n=1 Tax=Brevundimonas diminuta TaxID=293 RepID=UPI002096CDF9|nr:NAD-dependent epimerase/dehydratase family protein [Brevundimonas diminuta]MCO8029937.1 NAD-dependent epimerase/dehydratase family protein [Brevundimonas diminuta]